MPRRLHQQHLARIAAAFGHSPDLVKERLFEVLDWRILRHRRITPGGID